MGIPVELWRARIGSFRCRGSTPKGHYAGVSDIAARLAAAYKCKHSKLVPARSTEGQGAAIFLLRVIVNGSRVLLRMVSRHLLVRLLKMADKSLQLSSRTASLLYNEAGRGGGVMRVMLVTASLTVTRDAMIHLLALLCNQAHPADYGAGYCSTEQQYSGGGGVVTLQCMIAAERLLAATLVYMMLILAGDIETNPGPTLSDKPKMHELTMLKKADGTKPLEVIEWITAYEKWKCLDFANMLLRDDVLVRKYQNDHKEKDEFVRIVLGDWLSRDDDKPNDSAVPRTWAALAECVSDAGLAGALSKAIRDTCQPSGSAPAVPQSPLASPSASSQQPSVSQPPLSASQPPLSASQPPLSASQPPLSASQPPLSASQPPLSVSQQPSVSQPPLSVSQQPSVSQPPLSASQPPLSASQPPLSASQPPLSASQPPLSASQPPLSASLLPPPAAATLSEDEVMDKLGYNITVSISNVTIQGPPATGKTSVIDLAMGRPPAVDRRSTGVAEPPSCSIIVGDDSSEDVEWEELTPDRMLDMVCETIEALAEPVDHLGTERHAVLQQHETRVTPTLSDPAHSPPGAAGHTPATKHRPRDFPQILTAIMQRLPKVRGSTRLFRTRLLLMSDSGGQPNYLDVFPLFVRNKCLALFTLKLNEPLHAIPQFSYCIQGHSISMADTMLQYSYWQLLESLAKSMSSFLPSLSQSSGCHGNARFAVVGTFADKMDECVSESLEDKNTSLVQSLKAYERLRINYKGNAIFPINAVTSDKKQRRQYMMELRRHIARSPSVEVTIKLRWFGFYLSLLSSSKAQQRAILSLQECLDIGRSLDMDEHETRKAITFFHNLNLILHYQTDELDMLVIINLKPILDLVSLTIGVSFIDEDELHDFFSIDLPAGAREHFQQHGCFDRQILHECFQFPRLLNAEAFINLLAEVKAVAIIEKSNEFFMPCALRYASKEEECKITENAELDCPWIVRLRTRSGSQVLYYVPLSPAFSPTLIVLLLSSHLFSIASGQQQYRNIFVLNFHNGGDVTIIERQLQLEIYYTFSDRDCSAIRSFIHKTILETEKRLSFDGDSITIEDSFLCSCSSSPQRESHHILFKPTSGPPRAHCELTRMKCELKEQELHWLSPAGTDSMAELKEEDSHTAATTQIHTATGDLSRTLSSPLTVKLLCEAVSNVTDWHGLGRRLGLTMSQLRGIELTYHMHGLNRLKAEMFDVWLKSSPSASWADLITALQAIRAAYSPTAPEIKAAELTLSELLSDICDSNFQPSEIALFIDDQESILYKQCTRIDLTDRDLKKIAIGAMREHRQRGIFQSFVGILESEQSNGDIVKRLKSSYKRNGGGDLNDDVSYHSAKLELLMKKRGRISMNVIQCMPFGPPRIGKTCVRDRLAGKKVKGEPAKKEGNKIVYPGQGKISLSTGAAEKVMKLFVERSSSLTLQEQEEKWVLCDYDYELISVVKGMSTEDLVSMSCTTVEEPNPSDNADILPTTHIQDMPAESVKTHIRFNRTTSSEKQSTLNLHHRQQQHDVPVGTDRRIKGEINENIDPMQPVRDAFLLKDPREVNALLRNSLTIHFTDTGGQPEFQEIIPMLVAGPSLFLLVFSLATGLDHTYEVRYDTVDEELQPYISSFTVQSVLLQCLASIACIGTERKDKDGESKFIQSKVLFIGTQYDLLSDTDKNRLAQLDQINSQLWEAIGRHDLQHLVEQCTLKRFIFAVDNYDESDHSFKIIRKAISDMSKREAEMYQVDLPVSFVLLDFCLRKPIVLEKQDCQGVLREHGLDIEIFESFLKDVMKIDMVNVCDPKLLTEAVEACKNIPSETDLPKYRALMKLNQLSCYGNQVMTMEKFKAIAERCGITSEAELDTALWALHHLLGTIRYYPQVPALEGTVIIDQQLFFNIPTKLITSTFSLNRKRSIISSKPCEKFYNDGFFTKKDLDQVWEQELTHLTSDQLVGLLLHLHILAPSSNAGEPGFFLPCVLKHTPLHDKQQSSTHNSIATPLLLSFACGFTPNGMFSSLLSFFLQHSRGKFGLHLDFRKDRLFRDQASFYVEPLSMYMTLTIKSMPEYISFSLHQERVVNVTIGICATVKKSIEEGLKEVASRLNYNTSSILDTDSKFGFECNCDHSKPAHFIKCESPSCSPIKCSLTGRLCPVPSDFTQWFHELESPQTEDDDQDCAPLAKKPMLSSHHDVAIVVPELQMCGYGAQQKNAPDPSSYWGLRDCKYIGEGTTLMLFDTGIDWTHPSFASKGDKLWLLQYKQHQPCGFDEDGHGTMCAGIACGDEYGKPVICRGVAPGAKLGIWKAYTLNGEAGNWANQLAQLIDLIEKYNRSIDVLVIPSGFDNPIPELYEYIKKLDCLGVIIVCAGSNEGAVNSNNIAYPARYDETICVGSNDRNGGKSSSSPEGAAMEFLALGDLVFGPKSGQNVAVQQSGTSFAASALGGLICLILQVLKLCQVGVKLDRQLIVHVLKLLTNKNGEPRDTKRGYGAIAPDKLKHFFANPKHFIERLKMDNILL